jgi:endonuclease YncB( thermonuclease family)
MTLENCTFANTTSIDEFIVKGEFDAKVLKVYDGDTVWVAYNNAKLGYIKAKVRLNKINAPEMRGHASETAEERDIRKSKANASRMVVEQLTNGKIVKLLITGLDKYSRILGDILLNEEQWYGSYIGNAYKSIPECEQKLHDSTYVNLSNFMLYGGYAVPYIS